MNPNQQDKGQEDVGQAAKQNRWGSLAARLEVQCEDILSMEPDEVESSVAGGLPLPLPQQHGDASGLFGAGNGVVNGGGEFNGLHPHPEQPELRRQVSAPSTSGSANDQHQQMMQLQTREVSQDPQPKQPPLTSKTKTSSLKDWIVTENVDKEIKEATSSLPSNGGMSPFEKQRIERCVKIAHLLVANLAKKIEVANEIGKNPLQLATDNFEEGVDDWEPKAKEITEDVVTITVNEETRDIIEVGFDIYQNFNWCDTFEIDEMDQPSNEQRLGGFFDAIGKLLYKLFLEGEDVPPCPTSTDIPSLDGSIEGSNVAIPDEDDILDMLRRLPTGTSSDNGGNDWITSTMRKNGNLPMSLCRLVGDLLHSSTILLSHGISSQNNQKTDSCFASLSDVCSDIQQMIEFPDAFLYSTIKSRWELVFGNNHMFGRKEEVQQLMDAAYRIQNSSNGSFTPGVPYSTQIKKEVVLVNGHAGSGKSRLVQEIRKPLQAWGWRFVRCKFGKTFQAEPLSLIALGLDEYFSSSVACASRSIESQGLSTSTLPSSNGCSCANSNCPRKACQRLEASIGIDGIKSLSQQMPGLRRLVGNVYAHRRESLAATNGALIAKFHTHHLFGALLDTFASISPVLFLVDDLQWADAASLELLTSLITRNDADSKTNRILFVGAYCADTITEEISLKTMIQQFEECVTINTTQVPLHGFQLESLNEMVSEALCLPRRNTRSLSQIIHLKTQGFPLFVAEFLDALLTEKMLILDPADGWDWDVDVIDLKGISKNVAELLTCKLKRLPKDVLSGIQVLSCFGSHVDSEVLEAVKNYDGNLGDTMMPALYTAQKEGLVEKAGPTFTFSHNSIQHAAFDLIPTQDRIPLLQKLVSCIIPCRMQERESDNFLFVAVDLINRIGRKGVTNNADQCQLFARLNLEAGEKSMAGTDFSSAGEQFRAGISFLQLNCWENEYELTLKLFESSALASYSEGNHEHVVIQADHVLSNAKSFEDKFNSYCVFINVIAIGSMARAAEKIYELLRNLGENIDPNVLSPQIVINECIRTHTMISGTQKDKLFQLVQMTDPTKLMTMKLMAMLTTYCLRQESAMSGYLACRMILISLQYGRCEDTVFALSVFSVLLGTKSCDGNEDSALGHTALSLSKFYDTNQIIPRVYGIIYGCSALFLTNSIQSLLDPLLKACRLSFSNGNFEHSFFNTMLYVSRSWIAGKNIPKLMNEMNAFARYHKQHNHMDIVQLVLSPVYSFLSSLSGIKSDTSGLLAQMEGVCYDDIVETSKAKNEAVFARVNITMGLMEAFFLRDFITASQIIRKYQDFYRFLDLDSEQMEKAHFEIQFYAGLVSFHMARETRETHWMKKGMNVLANFERWSSLHEWNFLHRFLLLKAELHHTNGDTNAATQAYDMAAQLARKHCFFHHEGLACELAAHYFGNIGVKERTREMIQRSHDAYMEVGAARKAQMVITLLELNWLEGNRRIEWGSMK